MAPAVYGTIDRGAEAVTTGRVRLQVRSRDNAALGGHREVVPGDDGSFAFDQLALAKPREDRSAVKGRARTEVDSMALQDLVARARAIYQDLVEEPGGLSEPNRAGVAPHG